MDERTHRVAMLTEALFSVGARTATIGNRKERREAARELQKTPGADWYIPPVARKGWRR